ncbi:MAG: helix-turn-helix domain-containing protein [Clostridia bacterium]|jgi:TrpR-related protein YerC/YecD|nr:helix-turn-helix domain-containing protein [Clostridia bacterium]
MALKHDAQTDELFRSILELRTLDECYLYFEDLCTNKEIRDLGQRLEIARLISEGKSYLQAAELLGVSSATIGRVKRCLDYGDGGYQMILDRLKEKK